MSALGTGYPTLICRGTGRVIRGVNRRAAGQQCMRQSWTAVVR